MKPSTLFRLSAVVLFLYATGHTLGGVILYRPHSPAEADLISAMQSSRIDTRGVTRSLWDFYYGFGLAVGVLSYVLAGITWTLGSLANQPEARLGRLAAWVVAGCLLQIVLCFRYFFALPAVLLLIATVLCIMAAWLHHAVQPAKALDASTA